MAGRASSATFHNNPAQRRFNDDAPGARNKSKRKEKRNREPRGRVAHAESSTATRKNTYGTERNTNHTPLQSQLPAAANDRTHRTLPLCLTPPFLPLPSTYHYVTAHLAVRRAAPRLRLRLRNHPPSFPPATLRRVAYHRYARFKFTLFIIVTIPTILYLNQGRF